MEKQLQEEIEQLQQENEDLHERLRIFDVFLAEEDATEKFIESTKSHIRIHEELFPDNSFSWKTEKQMIEEYQAELDMLDAEVSI